MGLWKERKRPRRARSSGSIANRSWPLKSALPPVTSYEGWPTSTFVNVLLPDPFLPMMACVSPSLMVSVTPFRISSPVSATLAVRSFTSSSTSPFAARTLSAEARAPLAPRAIFPDAPKRARAFLLEESPAADARAPTAAVIIRADIAESVTRRAAGGRLIPFYAGLDPEPSRFEWELGFTETPFGRI